MPERVHYPKAPIIEALIDLRVQQAATLTVEQLSKINEIVGDDYPNREEIYLEELNLQVEQGQAAQAKGTSQHIGFRFVSLDERLSFQARLDGFTFTLHPPYTQWESFRDEAHRLWNIYCSIAAPQSVVRAALRYINRLDLPSPNVDLNEYLRTHPKISDDLSHGALSGFFMQLQLPQSDLNCTLVLNQASVPPPQIGMASIALDIDLFSERPDTPWKADDAAIWEFLEQLRYRKNEVFEASITDKTKELIR